MVQSLGIAVGNQNSYVAAGQGGGIEILLNEYSSRATPSMVAFTDHSRSIGVDASSNFFMNLKNTVYDLLVLLGKPYKNVVALNEAAGTDRPTYPFKFEEGPNGEALVVVNHLGQQRKFTITQVLAMLFTKLRGTASDATDCVLSCPQFFDDHAKDALIQAALIAGLHPLQVISDMSAVVLNYAYYRTTKEDAHKFIAFINFGHSSLQSVVAWLTPKEDLVRILAAESEEIGGRDFDLALANYFSSQHKLNLNQKAHLKLVSACEKLKRNLSANADKIPIHVESLISEDKDFSSTIDRATFENLIKSPLGRIEGCFKRTYDTAKRNFEIMMEDLANDIKAAEEERAVAVSRAAEAAKVAEEAKATLKAEKAKAADASKASQGATPTKADDHKSSPETTPVDGQPNQEPDSNSKAAEGDQPSTNGESDTKAPMEAEPESLTKAKNDDSKAKEALKAAKSAEKAATSRANRLSKLADVKFDLQIIELVGGSTRVPAIKQLVQQVFNLVPSTTLNTDEAVARGCVLHCATLHPSMKVKREVKIVGAENFFKPVGSLTCDKDLRRVELELITSDRKYKARTEARNNLEEFIYAERSKLLEGDQFLEQLGSALDWLFSDEGEEASEEEYNKRIAELKKCGEAKLAESNGESQPPESQQ